jgi:hypothetical protein
LNITVLSYLDSIDFGLIACRAVVPDVDAIAAHIGAEFEALKKAAMGVAAAGTVETLELGTARKRIGVEK